MNVNNHYIRHRRSIRLNAYDYSPQRLPSKTIVSIVRGLKTVNFSLN